MRRLTGPLLALCIAGCTGELVDDMPSDDGPGLRLMDGASVDRDAGSASGEDSGATGAMDGDGGTGSATEDAGGTVGEQDAGSGGTERCAGGPLAEPIAGCRPSPVPDTGDPYADCVARINQFRWECQCLGPLERWTEGESCADQHAEYDSTRPPHSGWRDRICDNGGSAQNECPGWGSIESTISGCLQLMWDEGPGEPFSEHGHYLNMSSTRFTRVACGFYTTSGGQVWAVQNFR